MHIPFLAPHRGVADTARPDTKASATAALIALQSQGRPTLTPRDYGFYPLNEHYGFAPIEAAAVALDLHNAAGAWNKALLDNAADEGGAAGTRPAACQAPRGSQAGLSDCLSLLRPGRTEPRVSVSDGYWIDRLTPRRLQENRMRMAPETGQKSTDLTYTHQDESVEIPFLRV